MKTKILTSLLLMGLCYGPVALGQNKSEAREIVQGFLKAWETNDARTFTSLLHKEVEFAYPGDRLGKEELTEVFKSYQEEKKDIRIYFWEEFFMEGDRFATAYQFAATDRVTGKRQAVGTGVTGRIREGKIILFKEYYDEEVSLLQYEGKLPLDEGIVTPWPSTIWLRPETID